MKKVCVIGHYGVGKELLNGQTVKTKTVTAELERQLGSEQVLIIDTHGGIKKLPKLFFQILKAFKQCENIIIFPAHNGIRIFVPLCSAFNLFFHRKLHYVVIGGWLNEFLLNHPIVKGNLKRFDGIYVETNGMKNRLIDSDLTKVFVMPNFKRIQIIDEKDLIYNKTEPYHVCTFSRVMKEKGIVEAVEAVKNINEKNNRVIFKLDIYGQIDSEQIEWFDKIKAEFPDYISYKGCIPFDQSVETLKLYHALLFPTYYEGEGFAGTLIDAMASGLPVIASDWKYNREIVVNGKTGVLFEIHNIKELTNALEMCKLESWLSFKKECVEEAKKYLPERAVSILLERL